MILLFAMPSLACKPNYEVYEPVVISDVIEPSGEGATCNLSLYHGLVFNQSGIMNVSGLAYTYNASVLEKGTYSASIICDKSGTEYKGECKFKVGEDDTMFFGILMLLPMILGIFLIIGATSLGEDHNVFKIFLYLGSLATFFISAHFGLITLTNLYDFPELEGLMGTSIYWISLVFFVVLSYFLIYVVTKAIRMAALKKKERLEY